MNSYKSKREQPFANCKSLKEIIIPDSVQVIEEEVFKGIDPTKLVIKGHVGSYAESFAKENGFIFKEQ
ncbi:MAG: hypothetical protein IKF90_07850 [Parasporobacterium sp.]|nr:hypothetical protein [Parasporobacterium sp.]